MEKADRFSLMIEVNKEGSKYKVSGSMTIGFIKIMIGELEVIKSRLIYDLEKTLDEGYSKDDN